jgi:hypothetical protein
MNPLLNTLSMLAAMILSGLGVMLILTSIDIMKTILDIK